MHQDLKDALNATKIIVTHANCSDGAASAWLLHKIFPYEKVKFIQYGTDEHNDLPAEPGMLFCDMSPPADRVKEFLKVDAVVLDHHKTAKDIVKAFGPLGVFGDESEEPGVSGALLAYRIAWEQFGLLKSSAVYEFARLIGIRDTWVRRSSDWELANIVSAGIGFWPFDTYSKWSPETWEKHLLPVGEVLCKNRVERVQRLVKELYYFKVGGVHVYMQSGIGSISDVAEAVREMRIPHDIVVGFEYRLVDGELKLIFSLRSAGWDVSKLSKHYGGGGHTKAAGFSIPVKRTTSPYQAFEDLVAGFLAEVG